MRLAFLVVAAFALAVSAAEAHDYKIGDLEIAHPWTRATPKGAKVAGGYLKITNKGTASDRLLSARFEPALRVEIHEIVRTGGTASMRELKSGLEIRPGATVELKPGGYHIMFMDLKQPLERGQRIKGALTFEKAGTIEVEFTVEAAGAPAPGAHGH
jgi:copper(I)-binding protein